MSSLLSYISTGRGLCSLGRSLTGEPLDLLMEITLPNSSTCSSGDRRRGGARKDGERLRLLRFLRMGDLFREGGDFVGDFDFDLDLLARARATGDLFRDFRWSDDSLS